MHKFVECTALHWTVHYLMPLGELMLISVEVHTHTQLRISDGRLFEPESRTPAEIICRSFSALFCSQRTRFLSFSLSCLQKEINLLIFLYITRLNSLKFTQITVMHAYWCTRGASNRIELNKLSQVNSTSKTSSVVLLIFTNRRAITLHYRTLSIRPLGCPTKQVK